MFFVMNCEMWKHSTLMESFTAFSYSFLRLKFLLSVMSCVTATIIAKKIRIKPISFFPRNPTLEILGSEPLIEHLSQKGFSFALTTLKRVALIQIGICKIDSLHWTERSVKRKLIAGAIPTIFPHKTQPKERTSSKARAKKSEKNEVRI